MRPEDRICQICFSEPETEEHFIFTCPAYFNLRILWLQKVISTCNNFDELSISEKFSVIMTDKRLIYGTSDYIRGAYLFRTNKLYVHSDS